MNPETLFRILETYGIECAVCCGSISTPCDAFLLRLCTCTLSIRTWITIFVEPPEPMNENHRALGDVDMSVYMTLLKAKEGMAHFVRFEKLAGALNLPIGTLEDALQRLKAKGWIERAKPTGSSAYYYAAI